MGGEGREPEEGEVSSSGRGSGEGRMRTSKWEEEERKGGKEGKKEGSGHQINNISHAKFVLPPLFIITLICLFSVHLAVF